MGLVWQLLLFIVGKQVAETFVLLLHLLIFFTVLAPLLLHLFHFRTVLAPLLLLAHNYIEPLLQDASLVDQPFILLLKVLELLLGLMELLACLNALFNGHFPVMLEHLHNDVNFVAVVTRFDQMLKTMGQFDAFLGVCLRLRRVGRGRLLREGGVCRRRGCLLQLIAWIRQLLQVASLWALVCRLHWQICAARGPAALRRSWQRVALRERIGWVSVLLGDVSVALAGVGSVRFAQSRLVVGVGLTEIFTHHCVKCLHIVPIELRQHLSDPLVRIVRQVGLEHLDLGLLHAF